MNYETASVSRFTKRRVTLHDCEAVRHLFGGVVTRRAMLYASAGDWRDRVSRTGEHFFHGRVKRQREVR